MLPVKNFYGELNGRTIYDFTRNLDYSLDLKGRLELVNSRLYDEKGRQHPFFDELFMQDNGDDKDFKSHISLCPDLKTETYSNTNIAKELEKMADYLLIAYNKENPNPNTVDYIILTAKELERKTKAECNYVERIEDEGKTIFIKDVGKNFKLEIKQNITKKDLEEHNQCGQILKEYQRAIDILTFELRKSELLFKLSIKTNDFSQLEFLNSIDEDYLVEYGLSIENLSLEYYEQVKYKVKKYRKIAKDMRGDMIYIKDHLKGTIYFKQPLGDSTDIDWEQLDWDSVEHIKELLRLHKNTHDFKNDLNCLVYDFEKILSECKFKEIETKVLHLWRNSTMSQKEIGEMLNIAQSNISKILTKICKKINNSYYNNFEDFYYLNIAKGKYKQCSCCKEIKLISKFNNQKTGKDGVRATCKICESSSRNNDRRE